MRSNFRFILACLVLVWLAITLALLSSCAWHGAVYSGIDDNGKPYTIELSARRFAMGQDVQGFSAQFPGGYKVGFDSSKGDPTKVMENFFGVLGPILQAYVSNQQRVSK